jgi:spore germination protein YaaH
VPVSPRRLRPARTMHRYLAGLLGVILVLEAMVAPVVASAAEPSPPAPPDTVAGVVPTVHYEDYLAHADDDTEFAPGGRVTVGFTPRPGDRALVGGEPPRALPAGRLSGRAMRDAALPGAEPTIPADPSATPPSDPADPSATPTASPTAAPTDELTPEPTAAPPDDGPIVDPADAIPAIESSVVQAGEEPAADLAAVVSPSGLRKEIFGFLPYWELNSSTVFDFSKLSTIAFFGVGASATGTLEKTTKDGSTTVGWSGWTSSRMTALINDAHRHNTRVVLTIQSFAWSTAGATKQKTLLGSATARANLAKQIAAAVRDRGADGVNLDFEPIASGYASQFTALVRSVRAELDKVRKGYQLTFDTTGYIGNYPIEDATAPGGADAIFIMGYDYRNGNASKAGSIAPIGGPAYDITDTILAYTARVPASKLILGVPYYGRAWSTETDKLNSKNISGTKYGASATVIYQNAVGYLSDHGRRYDTVEGVAWTAYKRKNCTDTYGCVTPWRQIYVDDARALKAKYDLVNRYGLRGAGIWALGYDGSRPELWAAIRDKFVTDSTPPVAGIKTLATTQSNEVFTVGWASHDDNGVASHDVDVSIDGGPWARWRSATTATSGAYTGARGHAFAFRVRARDHKGNLSSWTGIPLSGTAAKLAVGGFGRVQTDTLNARAAAGTDKAILTTLAAGDLVAFLQGPVSASGYTWYRVAAPLSSWAAVSGSRSDLWVATGSSSESYVGAVVPPNSTKVASSATLAAVDGARWFPVSPVRLLDTRTGNGLSGAFTAGTVRTVQVTGRGSVPVDAVAVTGNLTVTGATASGHVSIGPTMTAKPTTSTINLTKGRTLANGLTLRVGAGGTVSAVLVSTSGAKVHVVLDVTGYYRAGTGATWYPLAPTRLLDTRSGNGLSGSFVSAKVRTFQVAGRGSIPAEALAVSGNLTVTGSTAGGYVSIGPSMTSTPSTSTLNFGRGVTVANNVTLRLGSGGKVGAVYVGTSGARAHLILDVTGYYLAGSGGASWHPIDPVRLLDSRTSNGLSGAFVHGTARSFQLSGRGSIPVDAVAVTANLTETASTSAGFIAAGPTMTSSPSTSTINFGKGVTLANGVTLRVASGGKVGVVFRGASGAKVHAIIDVTGYFR